jgi:hypothetical protein
MLRISIFLIAMVSLLIFSVSNATEVILEDTPNVGDTTTITTITSGNPATTGNLVSQDFDDGSWIGTMFPDSSDINESTWLTGKDGKYAETIIDSDDHLSLEESLTIKPIHILINLHLHQIHKTNTAHSL